MGSVTTVSASASVNPLTPIEAKKSGIIQYAITASALDIGYTEYRKLDYKQGSTREINHAHATGERTKSTVKFMGVGGGDVTNPLDDYDDQSTIRNYVDIGEDLALDFMPMLLVKSDRYPDGIIKADDGVPKKVVALEVAKSMNVDLEEITKSILGDAKIPQIGTSEWNNYAKAYRLSGGAESEATYRRELIEGRDDKKKALDDLTDISVGYYGTFHKEATVMPEAMYHTLLSCLANTTSYKPVVTGNPATSGSGTPGDPNYIPPTTGTPDTQLGTARRFRIHGELFSSVYSLNGYIHREIAGIVPGNTRRKLGYSKATVHLNKTDPINTNVGHSFYNDYRGSNTPFFDKSAWSTAGAGIPDMYVSIKVQVSPTMYRELVLVDFYQETTIEGNGKVRRSNSGNQSENEKEMTWEEAYIAESFIPLTRSSMLKVKMLRRANLIIESKSHFMQMVNVTTTKLKWYQTGIFKVVMLIIAVVIFIYTGYVHGFQVALTNMAIGMVISYGISKLIEVLVSMGIISQAWAIAIIAVVAVYAMAYGANIKMDFTMSTVIMKTIEATGQVYAQQIVIQKEEYQVKADKLQEEKEKLEEELDELDRLHTSNNIGQLSADLQRMIDAVTGPLMEDRDEFLARTLSKKVVTETLTYRSLKNRLKIELQG